MSFFLYENAFNLSKYGLIDRKTCLEALYARLCPGRPGNASYIEMCPTWRIIESS
jgi:hypothetical protein